MSDIARVNIIVEGQTEQTFVRNIVAPYLGRKNIFCDPFLIGKPGHKGGNVSFDRAKSDVISALKQDSSCYVTTFFDFYGIGRGWPGYKATGDIEKNIETLKNNTVSELKKEIDGIETRFIPYFQVYEFEALLFSEPSILSKHLQCDEKEVIKILEDCGEPERINNNRTTAPSKRIQSLSNKIKYKKTTTGIAISSEIGLEQIRSQCPYFDEWMKNLESLVL